MCCKKTVLLATSHSFFGVLILQAFGAPSEGSKRTQCVFSAATLPKKGVQDVLTDMIPVSELERLLIIQ